jgi:serine/threonine protein kinase
MEICQRGQAWIEKDGELEFDFTKLILRSPDDDFFWATTKDRVGESTFVDLDRLVKTRIPSDSIWPRFSADFFCAPDPLPLDCYVKEPNLLDYGDTLASTQMSSQILHEIRICELLRLHPHPNIVTYEGCVVRSGHIRGLCFSRCRMTLAQRLSDAPDFDKNLCFQGIERGIHHLHTLGLVHNDINPTNIMMDVNDNPCIIDFDSCQFQGQKLGLKGGTRGWTKEGEAYARLENDYFSLAKLRAYMGLS